MFKLFRDVLAALAVSSLLLVGTAGAQSSIKIDVDADNKVTPLSDGLIVLRYLFGFRGDTLINGAVSEQCSHCSSDEIESYIASLVSDQTLDIDKDGSITPLSDGLMVLRYLFGFRGNSLINNAIGSGGERGTAEEIAAYIESISTESSNTPPTLINPGSQLNRLGSSVALTLSATDSDSDTVLSFSAVDLPDGLTLNAQTGLINGIPTKIELTSVSISVTDGVDVVTDQFEWEITTANGVRTIAENDNVTLDGKSLTGNESDTAVYSWSQVSGTTVELSSTETSNPTFLAPSVSEPETLVFELTHIDNGGTTKDTVQIIIDNDQDTDKIPDSLDEDRDGDGVSNVDDFFPDDPNASAVPTVKITSPNTLTTVGQSPIFVEGTVDSDNVRLTINGVEISQSDGAFNAEVTLEEGSNSIIARAINASNHEGIATISVSLDKTAPYVTIQNLEDGQTVYSDKIAVSGLVNDIVRGTVSEEDAVVKVNGVEASVSNRSFLAEDIPLVEGENTITISATDAVGNIGSAEIKVLYEVQVKNIISLESGQSQTGGILNVLDNTLNVKLTSNGEPVANKNVVFRVIEGDGLLQPGVDDEGPGALVTTNEEGIAGVSYKLGSRAGTGNQQVRARAVGYDGEIIFHASATYGAGNKVGVVAGNNQRGSVRQPLAQPFTVAVTDLGTNLIPDAEIEFKVTEGSGKFENGESTINVKTDKDGRASASFTLGHEEGLDVQRVTATLIGTEAVAGFSVSGFMPGDPGKTSISGVVLNNQDAPLNKVTVRVEGTARQAETDEQGQFEITEVPVGPVHLFVEGSTTTEPGEWPSLSYNIVTVPGVVNPLASPIYLVELDVDNAPVVGVTDTVLTLDEVPGFELKVAANSVTFPDGTKSGKLSVTAVNANKIPMPPPNGMQPQFIVTIQPHGAKFDPPAELTLPNVDGHSPGAEVELYSYDHDLEEFVTIGLGTVSKSGARITSNTGSGVIKAGWHSGSQPGGSGCVEGGAGGCGQCYDRNGASCPADCVLVPERVADIQIAGNCQVELCGPNGIPNDDDLPPSECGVCQNGKAVITNPGGTLSAEHQLPDDCRELLCGGVYNEKDETVAVQQKAGNECKVCAGGAITDAPEESSCGDGSAEQSCYTCGADGCKNYCDASETKIALEASVPEHILSAISGLKKITNNTGIFTGDLKLNAAIKAEKGEECCGTCGLEPQDYTEYSGSIGVVGDFIATVPGLGVTRKMPDKIYRGIFKAKAEFTASLAAAKVDVQGGATISHKLTGCPDGDCSVFTFRTTIGAALGPRIEGKASFESCESEGCKESEILVGAEILGTATLNIAGGIITKVSSGGECGESCSGGTLQAISIKAELSGSVTIKKVLKPSISFSKTIELYPGATLGPGEGGCS